MNFRKLDFRTMENPWEDFRKIGIEVVDSSSEEYESSRRVWNALINRKPSAILLCSNTEQVSFALNICYKKNFDFSVRGGGHSISGRFTHIYQYE
jgi:FAD/FMN-containing dehydrogenase